MFHDTPSRVAGRLRLPGRFLWAVLAVAWSACAEARAGSITSEASATATIVEPVSIGQGVRGGPNAAGPPRHDVVEIALRGGATYLFKGPEGLVVSVWTTESGAPLNAGAVHRGQGATGGPPARPSIPSPERSDMDGRGAAVILSLN